MNLKLKRFLDNPDCNMCRKLNFTETEQKDNKQDHECTYFNKRVTHLAITVKHKGQLYPCKECKNSCYINYSAR